MSREVFPGKKELIQIVSGDPKEMEGKLTTNVDVDITTGEVRVSEETFHFSPGNGSSSMSKVTDRAAFRQNYDAIFGKPSKN